MYNEFLGYERNDGSVGVRNHVLIIPTVVCASHVATRIAQQIEGMITIPHQHGCGQIKKDHEQTFRTLLGFGINPNVASVLVVGLGCEQISADKLADEIANADKPVESIVIQDEGGTIKAIEKGSRIIEKMYKEVSKLKKRSFDLSNLSIGVECGGSDATSGISANPAVGHAVDMVVDSGGTVIFSETTEFIGAEHILAKRGVNNKIAKKIYETIKKLERELKERGIDIRGTNPSPGNIKAGLSTIEEKSLGAITKSGSRPIEDVLEYAEKPSRKGLYIMDTPGQDVESITGMVAGGTQIIMFTTGLGSPVGSAITPVLKITGNPKTFQKMKNNIDIDVSPVIKGKMSIDEAGEHIFRDIIEVASGRRTASEILGHREFAITRIDITM